jgi:hypothetical protein
MQAFFMSRWSRINCLTGLSVSLIEELSFYLTMHIFEMNQNIIEPGTICPGIHMVFKGAVVIILKSDE